MKFDKLVNHLKINPQEFIFQFQSHPNYPSALAFSDTLNFLAIKNEAYELEKKFWQELPKEFIGIINEKFSLIKKENEQYQVYSDDEITLTKEELYKNSKDIVLRFEKIENRELRKKNNYPAAQSLLTLSITYNIL